MNPDGKWKLSPAYDVTYSHNPAGKWTNQQQMSVNGKRDEFTLNDLIAVGESISLSKPLEIVEEVVRDWPRYAEEAGVNKILIKDINQNLRINLK